MSHRAVHTVFIAALAGLGTMACSSDPEPPGAEPDPGDASATDGMDLDAEPSDAPDTREPADTAIDTAIDPATDPAADGSDDAPDAAPEDAGTDVADTDAASDVDPGDTSDAVDAAADSGGGETDADAPDSSDDTPWIRIGTGWDDTDPFGGFEPLDDRGTVRIAEGIQGGFHVWGGFEGRGMDTSDVESTWELTTDDGRLIGGGFFVSDMRPFAGHLATAGLTVFLALDLDVTTLDDVPHELCVDVTLADGSTASDCATVRPSCCDYL